MKIENLIKHELIGKNVVIGDAKNKAIKGLCGVIINETKELIIIRTIKGIKKIKKGYTKLIIEENSRKICIDGNLINKRPEERIKL